MAHYATGALGSLIPKLGKLLMEQYGRVKGVEDDIKFLVKELKYMQAFLEEVSDKPMEQLDKHTELWATDVREMSYEIEDKIDIFLVRVQGNQKQGRPHNIKAFIRESLASVAKIKPRHKLAGQIRDIKVQVKELKEQRDRYHTCTTSKPPTQLVDPRLELLYKNTTQLIGIDKSKSDLIKMLNDGDEMSTKKLKTVSVVGVGGLGKTTLVKAVFDKLKVDMECCAFVPVGQDPDLNIVLNTIHFKLQQRKCEMKTTDCIVNSLRDFLENKRYLIVVDDIWDNKHWDIIKNALVDNNCGSRIIATTRNSDVASKVGEVYRLNPLSKHNARKLFCTRIFHCTSKSQDCQLDEVPERIMSKCGGVPLAIITMASLLANKPTEEWPDVYTSIGRSHSDNEDVENTKRILSFSFYDMPSHLRACLLYLSVYPEDTTIDKDDLIYKWIAEGFVQDENGVGSFVLGERYYYELINRSMIQKEADDWSMPDYIEHGCSVHDMVLGLIRSLCVEYSFLTIVDNEQGTLAENNTVRRLSYQKKAIMEQDLKTERNMVRMRSFVAYGCEMGKIVPFSRFKVLRVLCLERCLSMEYCCLKFLGDLLHLRYLSLYYTKIRELPEELGALKFLQTLCLEGTDIEELPSCIGLLTQLVCLRLSSRMRVPADVAIGKLTSLEYLVDLVITTPEDESAKNKLLTDIANLRELRKLIIYIAGQKYESTAAALLELLPNLSKLRYLAIDSIEYCGWEAPGSTGLKLSPYLQFFQLGVIEFSSLPKCIISQLRNVTHLSLSVRSMDVCGMRTLGELPELRYLKLETRCNLVVDGRYPYFRKLTHCYLKSDCVVFLPSLSGAPIMPSVKQLSLTVDPCGVMSFCLEFGQDTSFIQTIIGLRNFPSLKYVDIELYYYYDCCCFTPTMEEELEEALRHAVRDHCKIHIDSEYFHLDEEGPTCNRDIEKSILFWVPVACLKRLGFDFDYTYLGTLPSLEKVIAHIIHDFATPCEVEEAMAGIRRSVDGHPNLPMLEMVLHCQDRQYVYRYAPHIRAPMYATHQNTNMEPQDPFDVSGKEHDDDDTPLEGPGLNCAPPVEEFNGKLTVDGIYLNLEGGMDLNLEGPIEDINVAELFADLVLGDPHAEAHDRALSYTPPGDVQGVTVLEAGSKTRADPNDEFLHADDQPITPDQCGGQSL